MALITGQVLNNRYRIVKPIAQGGYGAVYRAWDLNMECPRALKENLDFSPRIQSQFKLEAKILDQLSHPQLPDVIDHFVIPGQGQYLVMDFVEGEDLKEMLERLDGPVPEQQALDWILQVCDAVQYLHNQDPPIIHRDIKPANIKITPSGDAMLVDFGIAKVFDPQEATTPGAKAVTPGYSPPEQYGQRSTDARSDVYALGATLYNLLTDTPVPDSVDLMVGSVPSPVPAASLNPDVSRNVEAAIARALQFDRDKRFQSVDEFKSALEVKNVEKSTVLIHEPTEPQTLELQPPPTKLFSPQRKDRPGRLIMLILGMVGGVIIILITILFLLWNGEFNPFTTPTSIVTRETPYVTIIEITQTDKPSDSVVEEPTRTSPPDPSSTTTPTRTADDTQSQLPSPTLEVNYINQCEIITGEICIYSYGTTDSGLQVVSLEFRSLQDHGINLVVGGDEDEEGDVFTCRGLENFPNRYYCTGPLQPTLQTLLLSVYRSDDRILIGAGELLFLPPPPTPTHTKVPKEDCIGDACDDLQLPTP